MSSRCIHIRIHIHQQNIHIHSHIHQQNIHIHIYQQDVRIHHHLYSNSPTKRNKYHPPKMYTKYIAA